MQLKRLYIKEYKLFKDFTYDFPADNQHFIHILIGINGSGKSTILEVIAEIFSCVLLGEKAKFGFELEYILIYKDVFIKYDSFLVNYDRNPITYDNKFSGNNPFVIQVSISAEINGKPEFKVKLPSGEILDSIKEIETNVTLNAYKSGLTKNLFKILPDNIVIYYAGYSEILKNLCIPHNDKMSENLRKGKSSELILFHYYEPKLFNILLTGLLSYEYGEIPEYLKQKAKIYGSYSIEISMKKPYWGKGSAEEFWGAKGKIGDFLNFLKSISIKDMKPSGKGMVLFEKKSEKNIDITIFGNKLFEIKDYLQNESNLYNIIHAIYLDDLLDEINIKLLQEVNGKQFIFSDLSEGEQQAITIRGLTELLGGENSLFLFDEPDTFLHPRWQRNFISEIEENVEFQKPNDLTYLITTHSPQILQTPILKKTSVRIIEDGQLVKKTPKHYGRDFRSIFYNLMDLEDRNDPVRKDLSRLYMLLEDEQIVEAEKMLKELTVLLGDTDVDIQNATIQLNYLKEDEANH